MDTEELKKLLDSDEFKDLVNGSKHVQGLIANREEILGESKKYKELLAAYKDLGDVDTLKLAKEYFTKAEQERVAKEGESKDSVVLAQLKALQDKLHVMEEEKQNSIQKTVNANKDAFITKAISEAKGEPDLLAHIVGKRVKAEYENDSVKYTILDDKGEAWAPDGKVATIEDVITEIKSNQRYSKAFEPDVVSGGNTKPSNTNRKETDPKLNPKLKDFF